MNFLVPFLDEAVVETAAPHVRVVEFFYGEPEVRLVERVHSAGARTMAAVLAAGAAGVRVGTRFVATTESAAHRDYIDALVGACAADTVYTTAFSAG